MPEKTPLLQIPYPLPDDALVDYPALGYELAERIEEVAGLVRLWDSVDAGVVLPVASMSTPTIPATFKHLLVYWQGQNSNSAVRAMGYLGLRINGYTTGYYDQSLHGNNAAPLSNSGQAASSLRCGLIAGAAAGSYSSAGIILIPDYARNPLVHPIFALGGGFTGASNDTNWVGVQCGMMGGFQAAITSLTFLDQAGWNLQPGSRFTLYGVG